MSSRAIIYSNVILSCIFFLGICGWFLPIPDGLSTQAWHLLIIFLSTIIGIMLNPLPMGAITLISITVCVLTQTLELKECLNGFGDDIVWLILLSFFISRGFVKTGLGSRIAYLLIRFFGKNTLGVGYSLAMTELILSPVIQSSSARGGGVLFPIASALYDAYYDNNKSLADNQKNGGFIMQICLQSNVITSSMFLTASAANPLAVKLISASAGIEITWLEWFYVAIVPGLTSIIIMPLIVYYFAYPPSLKKSSKTQILAVEKLRTMGKMTVKEIQMSCIFVLLLWLWLFGKQWFGINATTTSLIGISLLLLLRIINFHELMEDSGAWHTFTWYAIVLMMSQRLSAFGVIGWIGQKLELLVVGFSPTTSIILLSIIYFYIHYIFASITTHISVLLPAFLAIFMAFGIQPQIAAFILIFLSILSSGLTHFGTSVAPIFFGSGHMQIRAWWRVGFIMSLVYIPVWVIVGGLWWKIIGLW